MLGGGVSPGLPAHVWSLEEVIALLGEGQGDSAALWVRMEVITHKAAAEKKIVTFL